MADRSRRVPALLARLAIALTGTYVGVLGAFVHRMRGSAGGIELPWGLALALVATGLVAWAAGQLVPVGGAWFGLGWTLVLALQGLGGAGSYVVGSDGWGWTYLGGGLLVLTVVAVLEPGRRRARPRLSR